MPQDLILGGFLDYFLVTFLTHWIFAIFQPLSRENLKIEGPRAPFVSTFLHLFPVSLRDPLFNTATPRTRRPFSKFSCSGFPAPCHLIRALLPRSFCAARSAAHGPWGGPSGPMGPSGPLAPHPTQAPALELRCIRFSSVRGLVSKCRGLLATEPQKAYCQAVHNISEACFGYFWGHGLKMLKMSLLKPILATSGAMD